MPTDHVLLTETLSLEPLAPSVIDGDETWLQVVRWVVYATMYAEQIDVTSSNIVDERGAGHLDPGPFGTGQEAANLASALDLDPDWAYWVVREVGNPGEIYARNLDSAGAPVAIPRAGSLNELYTNGGLHDSPPMR